MIEDRKQVDARNSWDPNSRKYILWVSFSHYSSQNVCCDTSRDVEVKLVGERIGSSGLVSTTCSALGSMQRRRTSRNLRKPAGMSREIWLDLAGDIHVDLARSPHCNPEQFEIAHAQLRMPDITA